ncbi:DEKNAAC104348 [Brettanomyces naardenensis]|uniref:Superoxide dismutase 1 copper chaperone n=1 Tax=Brettanomyces naardenensis TaxID=13370 RepID=A0A448YQK7_BRENA|nr:DEKNAAC104348 [Brettanomyces naardenensis]
MPSKIESFETVYNVPLTCDSCVQSVTNAVKSLGGIDSVSCDIENKRVSVIGSVAPSKIIEAIQGTGRDAIIRGTGKANSAAVSILESFAPNDKPAPVKGLARFVAISPTEVLIDMTMSGVEKGTYYPSIHASGNLLDGALSTGAVIRELPPISATEKEVRCDGANTYRSNEFIKVPLDISEVIGRSFVISKDPKKVFINSLCGVVARSAGAWENDKYVCACTGKTIWQERVDAHKRGITH